MDDFSVTGACAEAEAEPVRHEESERLREEQRRGDLLAFPYSGITSHLYCDMNSRGCFNIACQFLGQAAFGSLQPEGPGDSRSKGLRALRFRAVWGSRVQTWNP